MQVVCLNMGAGDAIHKSDASFKWINMDMYANEGVDIVQNLEEGLPTIENESIDLIVASHVFEHIKNWTYLMRECHRVLKPKGTLYIRVPEARCRAAIADPTHCNLFVNETWFHFDCDADIGFDTLGMRKIGFKLKWNEYLTHYRNEIDDGVPGNYFTELVVDLEKIGDDYPWEVILKPKKEEKVAA
jgi:SAM-dependent methyltransferase